MMMGNYGGLAGPAGAWILGIVAFFLLVAGVVLLAVWARHEAVGTRRQREEIDEHQIAANVLKERYAEGKITLAEYEHALNSLGERAVSPRDDNSAARRHPNRSIT